jgi:aminoglycoside 2'-N-acetyltransferase I
VLQVEELSTRELGVAGDAAVLELCSVAYAEAIAPYLRDIGPGIHLLGWVGKELVSHVMYVERFLQVEEAPPLRTAYIELVANHPQEQGKGYASRLLREVIARVPTFDIAALSPSDPAFYTRLGWALWRGPLFVRISEGMSPTPDEQVMVIRLPRTPPALDLDARLSIEWRPGEVW